MAAQTGTVIRKRTIAAPLDRVWSLLLDPAALAPHVQDVHSIGVQPSDGARRVVEWSIWLKGFDLAWHEEQKVDAERSRLEFEQVQGMFASYGGYWHLGGAGREETSIELCIRVNTGIVHLGAFVDPVIESAFADLAESLLVGVERASVRARGTADKTPPS